jgi:ferredoxin
MLVINPEECIDCGVCQPECPVDAIVMDTDLKEPDKSKWIEINTIYSKQWPVITEIKDSLPDADEWDGVPNKYKEYFSEEPGGE